VRELVEVVDRLPRRQGEAENGRASGLARPAGVPRVDELRRVGLEEDAVRQLDGDVLGAGPASVSRPSDR
jgi:hypothetical protein